MKYIINDDDYEIIVKNLSQVQSLAYIMGSNVNEDNNKLNMFWLIQDLVHYARKLVESSKIEN